MVLLVIVGYGAFLRIHDLGSSLYDDELYTRERAMQSIPYTLETRSYPLYYLLAKGSLAFGDTEAALRLPSFIAGLLTIVLAYGVVRQVHSRTAGLVAAAIVAFAPFHIYYSSFARYYALMMFFALLTLWCLSGILARGRLRDWLGYTLAAFLALASHVCFAPALAMMNVVAAVYLLCHRSRSSFRRRVGLVSLLALCTLAASSLLIQKNVNPSKIFDLASKPSVAAPAASVASVDTPPVTLETSAAPAAKRPMGGGLAFTDPATGKTRYRLTFYDCVEYLKTYFWNDTDWLWPLLLVLGVWGFVDLWFRVPALAAPLTGGFLLGPLSLFFVTSGHWYHSRYLSFTAVFAVVLVACGACVLPRFVARLLTAPRSIRLWRRTATSAPERNLSLTNLLYAGLMLGLVAPMAPVLNEAYNTYPVDGYLPRGPLVTNRAPIRDWKNLHSVTSQSVRDGDFFLFMTPEHEHGAPYTHYYLSRFLPWREEELRFAEQYGAPTPELLHDVAAKYPFSNLWFIGYQNYNVLDFQDFFNDAGAEQYNFSAGNIPKGLRLFQLGAPTTNYIHNGGFEGRTRGEQPEGVSKTVDDVYAGSVALQVALKEEDVAGKDAWETMFRTAVSPAKYRLRNNGFEAWASGMPVGWKIRGTSALAMTDAGFENTRGLKLGPAPDTAIMQQSIDVGTAPGRTLEVKAMGLSNTPDNLHLVLRYAGPGFQEEVHAAHPGSGAWAEMKLEAPIPAETNPQSITVEVWRLAGGEGDALVDDVELKVLDDGASLDPSKPYVLSLAARTENLTHKSGSNRVPGGRVRLAWVDARGNSGVTNLLHIRDEGDWRKLWVVFRPGTDFPAELKELYLEAGIVDGTGIVRFDQIQIEEGTQPSPFTNTTRLPHDETIGPRDLSAHAVKVTW
jgi:hypothetical protein